MVLIRLAPAAVAVLVAISAPTQQPFAPAVSFPMLALSGCATTLDLNRDGSPDVVAPGFLISMGFSTMDESGGQLALNPFGPVLVPPPGGSAIATPIALAAGDLDGDGLDDIVAITSSGSLHWCRNLGSTGINEHAVAADVLLDSYALALPANPPFIRYSFPKLQVADLDGDGNMDILAAGGLVDSWSGVAGPGIVRCYLGDGSGGFQAHSFSLSGDVIDAEWADLDGNGSADHIVVLEETGAVGVFTYQIHHLQLQAGGLVAINLPQIVFPDRCTAMAIGDLMGDANPDYLFAHAVVTAGTLGAATTCYLGDGQGNLGASDWGGLPPLPANAIGDFISALQIADFDRDGHQDYVALRGVLETIATPQVGAVSGDAELLLVRGPNSFGSVPEVLPVGGAVSFSGTESSLFALRPIAAEPDALQLVDLGRDRSPDLLIAGVREINGTLTTMMTLIRNQTPPAVGDPRFQQIGYASGGVPSRLARIGFDGGLPVLGNQDFGCTIQNVQAGSLVGLMWGPWAQQDLGPTHGFMLHLAPTHFGYAAVAQGNGGDDGFYEYPLPIPNDPTLIGDAGYFQYNYYDPVAGVFGATQATGIWIGQ